MANIARFNSRTPGGVRPNSPWRACATSSSFNSRTPGGVRPRHHGRQPQAHRVSIHAPREGCDGGLLSSLLQGRVSIHAPREGCDLQTKEHERDRLSVSIHAPREGCDFQKGSRYHDIKSFNSRTPGGVRLDADFIVPAVKAFQFTHPGRGATGWGGVAPPLTLSFNSRTPGGVRLGWRCLFLELHLVSIHAPREGCDSMVQSCLLWGG